MAVSSGVRTRESFMPEENVIELWLSKFVALHLNTFGGGVNANNDDSMHCNER